jgi:uncharacterized membrane protein
VSAKTHDVVIAGYMTIDPAKEDFMTLAHLVESEKIKTSEGVILVQHDYGGQVHVNDAADHHGRQGLAWGGGVGLLVGLFAPPLLASVVVGAAAGGLIGKFVKHRIESGIEKNVGETLPEGWAGVITLVEDGNTVDVKGALRGAAKITVVGVDGDDVKALKQGLLESSSQGAKAK